MTDELIFYLKQYFSALDTYRKSGNNQRYLPAVWQAEKKVRDIVYLKVKQNEIEWLGR